MVSIIVPIYNAEKVLKRCVESILHQEYHDFELLLIDDGSNDNSWAICKNLMLKDTRIRAYHQNNHGASSARNLGIQECNGEYVVFIDCDDYVSSSYLSDFDLANDYDFQIQGFTLTYPDRSLDKTIIPALSGPCAVVDLLEECELNSLIRGPVCKLFKRDLLIKYKLEFPKYLTYGEDAIFVKQYLLYCNEKCKVIAKSNYYYTHESSDSLTSRFHSGIELYKASLGEYQVFNKLCEKNPCLSNNLITHFKWLKAIDIYQSIHNIIIDDNLTYKEKKLLIDSLDNSIMKFVRGTKKLPIKFKLLEFCYNKLASSCYIHILRVLYK